jgi:hypothetical protein
MIKHDHFDELGNLVSSIDTRSLDYAKSQCIYYLKLKTSHVIESAGLDEKTQLNAIAGIYSPERCEAIKNYIAACRNEYLRCKGLILAATTNDEADAVQFSQPSVPENL